MSPLKPGSSSEHIPANLPEAPGGGIIVQKNVMVPMRDGVHLATDIYRPAGLERYPVVLIRTPYGSQRPEYGFGKQARFYVTHGYVFAVQDCRGKYESEGDWYGKRDEAQDGSDTITWLGTQPWSSGKVGMTGGSYLGMVQYLVADQQNPYLKALVPMAAPVTLGRDIAEYDRLAAYCGRESTGNLIWMIRTDGRVGQSDESFSLTFEKAWDYLPRIDYPKVFGRAMPWWIFMLNQRYGFYEEYFLRAAAGEWSKPVEHLETWYKDYKERYRKVNVPMLHISGWYDSCSEPPTKIFQLVREQATDLLARNNQQLMMGPWHHGVGISKVGDFDFGPEAQMDMDRISLQWFDRWLKGEDNGMDRRAHVRVFVQGRNQWREADDWPIPGTQFTKYYLHSAGGAHLAAGGGRLSKEPPGDELADHYTYDPANPTPTPAGSVMGPKDMTAIENRDDVLVYTSAALDAPMEVTGPLSAVLYVATSAPSTDLFVRLIDVHPDGKAYPVFYVWANPYRTYWAREVEEISDGTHIIKAEITLPPTSILFETGHRIRVEICSACEIDGSGQGVARRFGFRGLNVEPGAEAYAARWDVARQTIYHDTVHPSHVLLPVIPAEV